MSFNIGTISGGRSGNPKRVNDKRYEPWPCECVPSPDDDERWVRAAPFSAVAVKMNPGYLKGCIDCGTSRPEGDS